MLPASALIVRVPDYVGYIGMAGCGTEPPLGVNKTLAKPQYGLRDSMVAMCRCASFEQHQTSSVTRIRHPSCSASPAHHSPSAPSPPGNHTHSHLSPLGTLKVRLHRGFQEWGERGTQPEGLAHRLALSTSSATAGMLEPSFRCQSCKARLVLVRGTNDGGQQQADRRSDPGLLAALDATKIEESFIVLDDRRGPGECWYTAAVLAVLSSSPDQALIRLL